MCVFLFKMSFRKSLNFKNLSYEDHLFGVNFKTRKKTPWPALESFFVTEPPKVLNFRLSSQNLTLLPLQKTMLKIFVSISSTKKVEICRLLFNVIIAQLTLLIHQRCSRGQTRTIFLIQKLTGEQLLPAKTKIKIQNTTGHETPRIKFT